jgi:predicted DNA-binding protein
MDKKKDKRIHVTFSDTDREILEIISSKENRSLSDVVRRMVENWMERYEDEYWCDIISIKSKETISLEEVKNSV